MRSREDQFTLEHASQAGERLVIQSLSDEESKKSERISGSVKNSTQNILSSKLNKPEIYSDGKIQEDEIIEEEKVPEKKEEDNTMNSSNIHMLKSNVACPSKSLTHSLVIKNTPKIEDHHKPLTDESSSLREQAFSADYRKETVTNEDTSTSKPFSYIKPLDEHTMTLEEMNNQFMQHMSRDNSLTANMSI